MKGIVLAGGTGSRLWPSTRVTSKQLLPVFDKPMIYYPIATLMQSGIREILIITTPRDRKTFEELLGDGSSLGVKFSFVIQEQPKGIAEAYILCSDLLDGESSTLILGDNLFQGENLREVIGVHARDKGCHIFVHEVANPKSYGVLEMDVDGIPISIEEKPEIPKSNLAITGLYLFDSHVTEYVRRLSPSLRGELEITALMEEYMLRGNLKVNLMSAGSTWLDTGTPENLHDASSFVRVLEERTGRKLGCPEEIAFRNKWMDKEMLKSKIYEYGGNSYGRYLEHILDAPSEEI